MDILMLRSIINRKRPKEELQVMKWKRRINITWNISITVPTALKKITIEIDKLLINCEYINFFMHMYMQWIKDNGSTSFYRTLIIIRLPRFEKLDLSQFQLYIEAQTTTQCFVCRNCKKTILIRSAEGKERGVLYFTRVKCPYWFAGVE